MWKAVPHLAPAVLQGGHASRRPHSTHVTWRDGRLSGWRDGSRVPLRSFMVSPPTDSGSVGTRGRAQGHRGLRSADHPCGGHRKSNQRMEDPVCWEAMVKGKRSGKPHGAWCPWGSACGCDLTEREPLTEAPTSRGKPLTSLSDVSAEVGCTCAAVLSEC